MDDLVSRGHRYHDLVEVYPFRLVLLLHEAGHLNRRAEMVAAAGAMSAGISNSLDLALNSGKNHVLQRFAEIILKMEKPEKKAKPAISERAGAFLSGLPVRQGVKNG